MNRNGRRDVMNRNGRRVTWHERSADVQVGKRLPMSRLNVSLVSDDVDENDDGRRRNTKSVELDDVIREDCATQATVVYCIRLVETCGHLPAH